MPFKVAVEPGPSSTHIKPSNTKRERKRGRGEGGKRKKKERERREKKILARASTRVSFSTMYPEETESRAYLYYR